MLALLGTAALVLVAAARQVLPAAGDEEHLEAPENVEVYIIDDTFTLKWNRSNESVENVTFSADYQTGTKNNSWMKLPGCQHIAGTICDFSSLKPDIYKTIKLRIRAEKGNNTSSWQFVDPFVPHLEAHMGPPGVHLQAEDKAIIIYISNPGGKDGAMWTQNTYGFLFNIVMWENSTGIEKQFKNSHYREKISKLSPQTTYCLKVKARLLAKRTSSPYSPVYCINTTADNELPAPENVKVDAVSDSFILKWDYPYGNMTFEAQWLPAYSKRYRGNYSDDWKPIPECKNVKTTQCVFPKGTLIKGTYFISVRATNGNNTSFWSEERKIDTDAYTVMFPPVITVKSINDSLRVYVRTPEDSMKQFYPLAYEIILWESSSNLERRIIEEKPDFSIANLQPLTTYCIKVRAQSLMRNKSSDFSEIVCEKTKPGTSSPTWIIAGICIVLVSILLAIYVGKGLLRYLSDVFFPSLKPPSNITECFSEKPVKNLLLLTSEEEIERCFVVENTDTTATVTETNETDKDHKMYNSQSSQDSGNYSNEDENLGSKISEELLQQETVSSETSSGK